jgi:hypothetical protein
MSLQNLQTPVSISLPVTAARPNDIYQCSYFQPSSNSWMALSGAQSYNAQNKSMQCQTNHLSQFAVFATRSDQRMLVVAVVLSLDGILLVSLLVSWCLDRKYSNSEDRVKNTGVPNSFSEQKVRPPIDLGNLDTEGLDDGT